MKETYFNGKKYPNQIRDAYKIGESEKQFKNKLLVENMCKTIEKTWQTKLKVKYV